MPSLLDLKFKFLKLISGQKKTIFVTHFNTLLVVNRLNLVHSNNDTNKYKTF